MNGKEIEEAVIRYLDDDIYNYAIMINGGWGTGKTYFVKEKLLEAIAPQAMQEKSNNNKSPRQAIYVSAYGINNPDDLESRIFSSVASKLTKIGIGAFKILKKAFEEKMSVELEKLDIEGLLTNLENTVLVIDDIERSNCDINELFGYINEFVEHEGIKVILVANETQLQTHQLENKELKYLAVKPIQVEVDYQADPEMEKIGNTGKLTPDDFEKRVRTLFNEQSEYSKVKEKLVGITFDYTPDFKDIAKTLIHKHIEQEQLKKCLLSDSCNLASFASFKKHENIRTLQFFLSKMNEMYQSAFHKINDVERLLPKFIKCYWYYSIAYKLGEEYKFVSNDDYGHSTLVGSSVLNGNNSVYGFRFIDEHIRCGTVQTEHIHNVLSTYIADVACSSETANDPINILVDNWIIMSDDEIRETLTKIEKNLDKRYYAIRNYGRIIERLAILVGCGFEEEIFEDYINLMELHILMGNYWRKIEPTVIKLTPTSLEVYDKWRGRLNEVTKEKFPLDAQKSNSEALNSEKWGLKLYQNSIQSEPEFWNDVNIELLLKKIEKASDENLGYLIKVFSQIHGELGNHGDIEEKQGNILTRILEKVESLDVDAGDIMMNFKKSELIKWCNSILESFKSQ